jgi:hypothetical protein
MKAISAASVAALHTDLVVFLIVVPPEGLSIPIARPSTPSASRRRPFKAVAGHGLDGVSQAVGTATPAAPSLLVPRRRLKIGS